MKKCSTIFNALLILVLGIIFVAIILDKSLEYFSQRKMMGYQSECHGSKVCVRSWK